MACACEHVFDGVDWCPACGALYIDVAKVLAEDLDESVLAFRFSVAMRVADVFRRNRPDARVRWYIVKGGGK